MTARRGVLLVLALPLLSGGCRYFRMRAEPADTMATAEPTVSVQAVEPGRVGALRDGNIAAMLLAFNNTDISYARLVPSRAERDDVKQFAERMLTDHIGVNALVTEFLAKHDMAAQDNIASLDLRDESAAKRDAMRGLNGFAFDSAYATNEVSYHQKFLAAIDNVMAPAARNDDLKTLLNTVRPAVAAHLAHAEQVWANVMTKR